MQHYEALRQACLDLGAKVKVFIQDYEKGDKTIMLPIIKSRLEMAVVNAKRANETAKRNETDNPITQMDELVDYLKNPIKNKLDS